MSYAHPNAKEELPCGYRREDLHKWASETSEPYFYADPVTYISGTSYPAEMEISSRKCFYSAQLTIEQGLYEQWINNSFTKCILEAKNRNQLMKAATIAESLDMREGRDFFLIRDNCLTELEPEDEDGRTLTCIGFKPMDSDIIDKVGKKFQLWK